MLESAQILAGWTVSPAHITVLYQHKTPLCGSIRAIPSDILPWLSPKKMALHIAYVFAIPIDSSTLASSDHLSSVPRVAPFIRWTVHSET